MAAEGGNGSGVRRGGQGVGNGVSHGRRARERNFVCSQYLASVCELLSFDKNIFTSVSSDSFLLLLYASFDYS